MSTKSTKAKKPSQKKSGIGIHPLADRVLVLPLSAEEATKTKSGIIIPETVDKEKPHEGRVLAVGPGRFNEDGDERVPMTVKVGDRVIFSKYSPDEIKLNGQEYYMISESSILGIIE